LLIVERYTFHQDINSYRDKVASLELLLEQKEKQIDELLLDADARDQEHEEELKKLEDEFKQDIEDAKIARDEIQGVSRSDESCEERLFIDHRFSKIEKKISKNWLRNWKRSITSIKKIWIDWTKLSNSWQTLKKHSKIRRKS
jgi:hypothetical protein